MAKEIATSKEAPPKDTKKEVERPLYYLVSRWAPQPRMDGGRSFVLTDVEPQPIYHYPIRDALWLERMNQVFVFEGVDAKERAEKHCADKRARRSDFASRQVDDLAREEKVRHAILEQKRLESEAQMMHFRSGRSRSVYECMLDLMKEKERSERKIEWSSKNEAGKTV